MLIKRCKQWLLAGMLWSLCAAALAETVFEWTDADGVKHFSSKPPPPGVQANEKQVMPVPMVGTVAPQLAVPSEAPPEEDSVSRERAELARQRISATSYEEALAVECDHARGVLGKLRANQSIVLTDDSGNSRAMPEPERYRRVQLASDFIRDNCR